MFMWQRMLQFGSNSRIQRQRDADKSFKICFVTGTCVSDLSFCTSRCVFFFFYFSLLTSVLFTVFTVLYDLMEESTVKNFTKCCIMTLLNCQCSMKRTLVSRYDHFNMSFNLPSSSAKQPIKKQTLRSSDKCGHKAENMLYDSYFNFSQHHCSALFMTDELIKLNVCTNDRTHEHDSLSFSTLCFWILAISAPTNRQ